MKTAFLALLGLAAIVLAVNGRQCDTEPEVDCSQQPQKALDSITDQWHCCKEGEKIKAASSSVNNQSFFSCSCTAGSSSGSSTVKTASGSAAKKAFCKSNPTNFLCRDRN